jgi:hypothetical protein
MKQLKNTRNPKLSEFLFHHQFKHPQNCLAEVLGDAYLYKKNLVYKNIRDAVIAAGYSFSFTPPFDYTTFPLMSLNKILNSKIIPVVDNVQSLRLIESENPSIFRLKDFEVLFPMGNYLLHESSHCLAHSILAPLSHTASKAKTEKFKLMTVMIGEAFANATERTSLAYMDSSKFDMWMVRLNSYMSYKTKKFNFLKDTLGLDVTVKLCFALYLFSNFLHRKIDSVRRQQIFDFAGVGLKVTKSKSFKLAVKDLESEIFGLNPTFRLYTTEVYLKSLGFNKSLNSLFSFDPLLYVQSHPELLTAINQLAKMVSENSSEISDYSYELKAA